MESFFTGNILIFAQLIVALILGALVGLERSLAGKTAGMRTFALVSVGSALFVIIAAAFSVSHIGLEIFDPLRVAGAVVTGVGFIGAGLIIFDREGVHGLTTAAGMWVAAAIGVGIGLEFWWPAIFTTFLVLFTFAPLWFLEEKVRTSSLRRTHITIVEDNENV
ncbi:MAG: MgtC/SapB family protein [Candidatus Paceibacterota bacterium]